MTYEKNAIKVTFKMVDGTEKTLTDTIDNDFDATRQLSQYENHGYVTIDGEKFAHTAVMSTKMEKLSPIEVEKADNAFCNYECSSGGGDSGLVYFELEVVNDTMYTYRVTPNMLDENGIYSRDISADFYCLYQYNGVAARWEVEEGYTAYFYEGGNEFTESPVETVSEFGSFVFMVVKDGKATVDVTISADCQA